MPWKVVIHPEVIAWLHRLPEDVFDRAVAAMDKLELLGPQLSRPHADHVKGSRYANMKELRPSGTSLRILFAFDFERRAVVLVGGDKRGEWSRWYKRNIPLADRRFAEHLENLAEERKRK